MPSAVLQFNTVNKNTLSIIYTERNNMLSECELREAKQAAANTHTECFFD